MPVVYMYVGTPLPLVAVGLTYFKLSKFDFFDSLIN